MMSTFVLLTAGDVDLATVKLLTAALIAALATTVALIAGIVSRLANATIPQAAICAGTAFGGTATILLVGVSTFGLF